MKVIKLFIAVISCLMISGCQSSLLAQCFETDSSYFGQFIAINDNYLAIADPGYNRVIIYRRNERGKWSPTKEILPPKDSQPARVGRGFGSGLSLDKSILVISAYSKELQKKETTSSYQTGEDDWWLEHMNALSIYKIDLSKESSVEQINVSKPGNKLSSGAIINSGKIVFFTSPEKRPPKGSPEWTSKIEKTISILSDGKIIYIPEPKDDPNFSFEDLALKNNLLLVGFTSKKVGKNVGGALLFNLNEPTSKPQIIEVTPEEISPRSVAISDEFAAIGDFYADPHYLSGAIKPKTLIKSLKNGSTATIDGYGGLILDGNILARVISARKNIIESDILEIFRLNENATPHLIMKRKGKIKVLIYKNLLITTQETRHSQKVCLERLH
jgi:hypothetical protein